MQRSISDMRADTFKLKRKRPWGKEISFVNNSQSAKYKATYLEDCFPNYNCTQQYVVHCIFVYTGSISPQWFTVMSCYKLKLNGRTIARIEFVQNTLYRPIN